MLPPELCRRLLVASRLIVAVACLALPLVFAESYAGDNESPSAPAPTDSSLWRSDAKRLSPRDALHRTTEVDTGFHGGQICATCFTRDENVLITVGDDATIRVWNIRDSSSDLFRLSDPKNPLRVRTTATSRDGNYVAIAANTANELSYERPSSIVFLLDLQVVPPHCRRLPPLGAADAGLICAIGFDAAARASDCRLLTAQQAGDVCAWEIIGDKVTLRARTKIDAVPARLDHSDGMTLVGDQVGRIHLISRQGLRRTHLVTDLGTAQVEQTTKVIHAQASGPCGLTVSPDGTYVASTADDGEVVIWSKQCEQATAIARLGFLPAQLVFAPDSHHLLAVGERVAIVDLQNKAQPSINFFPRITRTMRSGAFSGTGSRVALGGTVGSELFVWQPHDSVIRELANRGIDIGQVNWPEDGHGLSILSSTDAENRGLFCELDFRTLGWVQKVQTLPGFGRRPGAEKNGASFGELPIGYYEKKQTIDFTRKLSAEYTSLGTRGDEMNPRLRVQKPKSGTAITDLIGHANSLRDVALSPSGLLMATVSADRTVRLWFPKSVPYYSTPAIGEPLLTLYPMRDGGYALWTARGRFVARGNPSHFGFFEPKRSETLEKFSASSRDVAEDGQGIGLMLYQLAKNGSAQSYIHSFIQRDLRREPDPVVQRTFRYVTFTHQLFGGRYTLRQATQNQQDLQFALNSVS